MEWKESIKIQFAHTLLEAMLNYDAQHKGKLSLRKLALQSDLEYSQVQRISKARVTIELSTVYALAYGLGILPGLLLQPIPRTLTTETK